MLVEVQDGRATKVSGDPDHPTTQGFLCTKVTRYLERVYNPDRLLYPMRRIGVKGEGRFERISWDEALDTIARRFREIAESPDGPEAILPYSYGGTMGVVNNGSMDRRFFNRLGASKLARTICLTTLCLAASALAQNARQPQGTPAEALETLPDFKVERLVSADPRVHGSWISMGLDNKGRLLLGGQRGQPITRVTLSGGSPAKVEALVDALAGVLPEARNIRHLDSKAVVLVSVSGVDSAGTPVRLTLKTTRSDLEKAAGGEDAAAAFRKALVWTVQ